MREPEKLLSKAQLEEYDTRGFLLVESVLSGAETQALNAAFVHDGGQGGEHVVHEDDGRTVRAVYAGHLREPAFAWLTRTERILGPASQLVSPELYVHQFKVNAKQAFGGESWAWHQDYVVWRDLDDMPGPRAVNVGVFLDDVTEFNGPVIFLPGTHRLGTLVRGRQVTSARSAQHVDPDDYALGRDELTRLVDRYGMVSSTGPAGSIVLFHPEIVHGSATNISPYPRNLLIITFNDVTNAPRRTGPHRRPEHLVGRDTTALVPTGEPMPADEVVGERRR